MAYQKLLVASLLCVVILATTDLMAQEPGWSMAVNPLSPQAQQIRQQDILDRPNRPGHFYGNTVRRMHYYGRPLPVSIRRGGWRR